MQKSPFKQLAGTAGWLDTMAGSELQALQIIHLTGESLVWECVMFCVAYLAMVPGLSFIRTHSEFLIAPAFVLLVLHTPLVIFAWAGPSSACAHNSQKHRLQSVESLTDGNDMSLACVRSSLCLLCMPYV